MANVQKLNAPIFLIGMMASGKTTLGKLLAKKLQTPFVDLDAEISKRTKKPIPELFNSFGEMHFRASEAQTLRSVVYPVEPKIIATGGGTINLFTSIQYLKNKGAVIYLEASPEILFERLEKQRTHRPLLQNENWKLSLSQLLTDRKSNYQKAHYTIQTDSQDVDSCLIAILSALNITI